MLFDFAERYSQDAFILEMASELNEDFQEDKIIAIKENFNYKDYFKYSFGISNRIGSKPKKIKFIIDKKFENYFINYKMAKRQVYCAATKT